MKMKKLSGMLLVAIAMTSSASAMAAVQVITIDPSVAYTTDWTKTLSFAGFDSSLGTLTGVSFNLSSALNSTVTTTNFSTARAANGSVQLDAALGLNVFGTSATGGSVNVYTQSVAMAKKDAAGSVATVSGATTLSVSQSFDSNSAVLGSFVGGTVNAYLTETSVSKYTGSQLVAANFSTSGNYYGNVTYTYTAAPVPEPETYGMLLAGLGLMGVVARRKAASRQA